MDRGRGKGGGRVRSLFFPALLALLPAHATQAATVAVAFDRVSIRLVQSDGMADRASGRKVSWNDPVRVASISKLVTSLAVLRLTDQGKLDLDRDVSDYLGWQLRNPRFPDAPITLRSLLSHQSSLRDGNEQYVIGLGNTLQAVLTDPALWDQDHSPQSGWFAYSNINSVVVASILERVTGLRFDMAMHQLVLKPLKLDACFNWGAGCSRRAVRHAIVLYRANGDVARDDLKGQWPPCLVVPAKDGSCDLAQYPLGQNGALFSPQGGLRISMKDLARIGQMLANKGRAFLSARAYAAFTETQWPRASDGEQRNGGLNEYGKMDGSFCAYGLGVQKIGLASQGCNDDLFGDGQLRLGHAGEAYGLRSGLWWNPKTNRGIAYFIGAVADDSAPGRSTFKALEEALVARHAP